MKHRLRLAWLLLAVVPALHAAADAPPGRYTITSGTVYDNYTKLTWQQSADSGAYTQAQAVSFCATRSGGWRAPKVSELLTIVDRMKAASPAIDLNAFPGTGSEIFWSATGTSSFGWTVDFTDGRTLTETLTGSYRVRCVR